MLQNIRHALMTSLAVLAIAKTFAVCVLFLVPTILVSQNNTISTLSFTQPNTSVVRTPNSFLLGWNFGYPARQTMDAMQTNVQHLSFSQPLVNAAGTTLTDWTTFASGGTALRNFTPNIARCATCTTYVIPSIRYPLTISLPQVDNRPTHLLSSDNFGAAEICAGFRYEPELSMADTTDQNFTPDANASDGAIFGFRTIDAHAVRDTTRMRFNAADFTDATTVLRNVWPQDQLSRRDPDNNHPEAGTHDEDTDSMFLVVNVRRGNAASDDSPGDLNQVVLRVRLRYRIGHSAAFTNDIQFDSVPNGTGAALQLNTLDATFGFCRPQVAAATDTRVIEITRRMIPSATAAGDHRDINIVAEFRCNDVNNPLFKVGPESSYDSHFDGSRITSMDIEVDYNPSIDVAVDFVGVRTAKAHHWLCGHYDPLIIAAHDENIFQFTHFSTISTFPYNIHRFYGKNEAIPMFWEGLRYFNLRMDTLAITEVGIEWPRRYLHHTKIDRLWQGTTLRYGGQNSSPALWQGNNSGTVTNAFRYNRAGNGFNCIVAAASSNWIWNHDHSVHSYMRRDYEIQSSDRTIFGTILTPDTLNLDLPMNPSDITADICNTEGGGSSPWSTMGEIEKAFTYQNFHGGHSFLFDRHRTWYANVWTEIQVDIPNTPTSFHFTYGYNRPKSAEEIRLQSWNQVILGAKGLLYYYGPSNRPNDHTIHDRIPLTIGLTRTVENSWFNADGTMGTTLNGFTNASLLLGYDFIPTNVSDPNNDTIIGLAQCLTDESNTVNFAYYSGYQNTANNRFYVGMRSSRMEAARCLTQMREIEDTLMHLHMMGWKAVGYRRWVSGDSATMAKYLYLDSMHQFVRPVNRFDSAGYPAREHIDSMFYDMTMHFKDGLDTATVFYVGVLNRRTNPRVRTIYPVTSGLPQDSILFYSGEEWRDSVRTGRWNRMAQLGSRMIRIPFHYTMKTDRAYNLRVKEVSWDTSVYSGSRIDTTVGSDVALEVAFQPGEGKFFRVEAIPASGATEARGFLDHSNQRKIVAYPKAVRIDTITDPNSPRKYLRTTYGDTVRYHMVYHRRPTATTTTDSGPVSVFYRRSLPVHMSKDTIANALSAFDAGTLQWEDEILISDALTDVVTSTTPTNRGQLSCAYPSLVVRTDSTVTTPRKMLSRVYIVYGCECQDETARWQILISEAVLPADSTRTVQAAYHTGTPPNVIARTYPLAAGRLENWGTPMINASATGNFYCWPNPSSGIDFGFKLPDQTWFVTNQQGSVHARPGKIATHPSLNTYSRLYLGEEDASLVWQEGDSTTPSVGKFIFYTHLIHATAYPFAPHYDLNTGGPANRDLVTTIPLVDGADNRIALLTDTNVVMNDSNVRAIHAFPVVYRHLSDWEAASTDSLYTLRPVNNKADRIYWQTQKYYPAAGKWRITRRPVDVREWHTVNTAMHDRVWTMAPHYIFDQANNLLGPDVTQGTQWGDPSSNPLNSAPWYGDSSAVLNFWSEASSSSTPDIWHMQYGWNYYGQNVDHDNADLVAAGWMQKLYDHGHYPHLAARHSYKQAKEWMRGRRILEAVGATRTNFDVSPNIMQSSQYFYKEVDFTRPMALRFGGFRGGENSAVLGPIMRQNADSEDGNDTSNTVSGAVEMIPMTGEDTGPFEQQDQRDHPDHRKLVSRWMEVPTIADVNILSMTEGAQQTASLYVERESTGELLEVIPTQTSNITVQAPNQVNGVPQPMSISLYTMLGSENERYRFVMIPLRGDVYQVEDIQLVQPTEVEALSKTQTAKSQILDLRSMRKSASVAVNDIVVSPSPARDHVRIVVNMRTDTDARNSPVSTSCIITDERGAQVHRAMCNTVDALTVPVGTWPTGVYNVRVMSQLPNGSQTVTAKSFMVLR